MSLYQVAGAVAAGGHLTLVTTSGISARLLSFYWMPTSSVATSLGIGRPAINGTTVLTSIPSAPQDPSDPAASFTAALTWSSDPTAPTNYFRRNTGPSTANNAYGWNFPNGIVIVASSQLTVLRSIVAGPSYIVNLVVDQ